MDMQDEQHTFFKDQESKKPDLRVIVDGTDTVYSSHFELKSTIRFSVHNGGNKSAEPFIGKFSYPKRCRD